MGSQAGLARLHHHGANHDAENEPIRDLVLASVRPCQPDAADKRVIDAYRARPIEGYGALRRSMGRQGVAESIGPGIDDTPCKTQRLLRFHDQRKFREPEPSGPDQGPRAALGRGLSRMRKSVAGFAQTDKRERRREADIGRTRHLIGPKEQVAPIYRRSKLIANAAVRSRGGQRTGLQVPDGSGDPRSAAMAALAALPISPVPTLALTSHGVVLIVGGAEAIEAGQALADRLDVTVLLDPGSEAEIPSGLVFPVARGRAVRASGHFGAYEVVIDGYCAPGDGGFAPARDGAVSRCDLILDLSGGDPLFPAHEARDGYIKPGPQTLSAAIEAAGELVGEFDKPRYIDFRPDLCAHSRSKITGCTRCLDVCAMQAISPAGDRVQIDTYVCAGCGNCAAVCPTGAASYTVPSVSDLLGRIRTLILSFSEAGGRDPVILFHDGYHGAPLVAAASLPPNVLPLEVNEVKQLGLEAMAAALSYGAAGAGVLLRHKPKNGAAALTGTVAMANALSATLGYGVDAIALVHADTSEELTDILERSPRGVATAAPSSFLPLGEKRGLLELTLKMLHMAAPAPVDVVPLPAGAPFGALKVDVENCTLCLSCVSVCPTAALSAGDDRPALYFLESACVQCGLCAATCPEDVIALEPRLDFSAWRAPRKTLKEEEPFCCVRCAKPFGTRSTVERVVTKLQGHWMYSGEHARRLDAVKMCEQCRVEAALNEGFDPYSGAERPRPRIAADYLGVDRDE